MSMVITPIAAKPDPSLLAAVGERLTQVLASNRRLAQSPSINFHARRRIEAVIAGLIDALDRLDGDADHEQTAVETYGSGFRLDPLGDEGEPDDNGLGDYAGHDEQMSRGYGLS
jgi:hypothetical protein